MPVLKNRMLDRVDGKGNIIEGFIDSASILSLGGCFDGQGTRRRDSKSTSSIPGEFDALGMSAERSYTIRYEQTGIRRVGIAARRCRRASKRRSPPWLTGKILKEMETIEEVRILRMIEEARYTTHTIVRQQPSYLILAQSSNSIPYRGEGRWRTRRGADQWRQHISKMMGEAGISHKVEPRGLFRGCCEVMNALVPDFSLNWPGDAEIGRTQDGALFSKKHVLQQVHDTTPGPIQAHLETLGKVVELVMGHFSEGSPDMHELVKMAAKAAGRNIGSG